MKKMLLLAAVLLGVVMIMVAADFRRIPGLLDAPARAQCTGYTIIEFDKGIDCNGDTISLVRKNGFAQPAQ